MNFRKRVPLLFLLFWFFCLISTGKVSAQCSGGGNGGALAPPPAAGWQTRAITSNNYYTFVVPAASGCSFPTYFFSFCAADGGSAGFDTQITILDNGGAYAPGVSGGYNDDACGLQSFLSWVPTAAGTYRVLVNTYNCSAAANAGTLAYRMAAPPASDPDFILVDDAVSAGSGCVTLTAPITNQRGCAWDINSTLDFLAPFSYDFNVNLGNNNGGADGIAFVIQNSPAGRCACGASGGSLGAGGITNSLIVEIDTYLNFEDRDDGLPGVVCAGGPDPDHMDIWLNGVVNPIGACPAPPGARVIPAAVKLMNGALDYDVENGLMHILRVSWVPGAPGTLTARLYDAAGVTLYCTVAYSFAPMAVFGTNTPFFGFTASTGGLVNQQSFCLPPGFLPVDEVTLSAVQEKTQVHLSWTAPLGYGVSEVFGSRNGVDWNLISAMPTQMNLPMQNANDPYPSKGRNFYRVVMHDDDGNSKVSNVVEVDFIGQNELRVYPNPAEDQVWVGLAGDGESTTNIRMVDYAGKVVYEQDMTNSEMAISTESMAPGIYLIVAKTANRILYGRVVVR